MLSYFAFFRLVTRQRNRLYTFLKVSSVVDEAFSLKGETALWYL